MVYLPTTHTRSCKPKSEDWRVRCGFMDLGLGPLPRVVLYTLSCHSTMTFAWTRASSAFTMNSSRHIRCEIDISHDIKMGKRLATKNVEFTAITCDDLTCVLTCTVTFCLVYVRAASARSKDTSIRKHANCDDALELPPLSSEILFSSRRTAPFSSSVSYLLSNRMHTFLSRSQPNAFVCLRHSFVKLVHGIHPITFRYNSSHLFVSIPSSREGLTL